MPPKNNYLPHRHLICPAQRQQYTSRSHTHLSGSEEPLVESVPAAGASAESEASFGPAAAAFAEALTQAFAGSIVTLTARPRGCRSPPTSPPSPPKVANGEKAPLSSMPPVAARRDTYVRMHTR